MLTEPLFLTGKHYCACGHTLGRFTFLGLHKAWASAQQGHKNDIAVVNQHNILKHEKEFSRLL